MRVRARIATVARVATALVAVMLSGGPRALATLTPAETHRCCCRTHGSPHHECDCAMCRRAALAEQAKDDKVPPCHRAAARKALSRGGSTGSRSLPCVEGTCGSSNGPVTTPAGVEAFCLPAATRMAIPSREEQRRGVVQAVLHQSPEPEKPPPRGRA
jgi:hypothetical protein